MRSFFNARLGVYFEQEAIAELDADLRPGWPAKRAQDGNCRPAPRGGRGQPRIKHYEALERAASVLAGAFGERMRAALPNPWRRFRATKKR